MDAAFRKRSLPLQRREVQVVNSLLTRSHFACLPNSSYCFLVRGRECQEYVDLHLQTAQRLSGSVQPILGRNIHRFLPFLSNCFLTTGAELLAECIGPLDSFLRRRHTVCYPRRVYRILWHISCWAIESESEKNILVLSINRIFCFLKSAFSPKMSTNLSHVFHQLVALLSHFT